VEFHPPLARFRLRCTKGTYVRTLCADIGRALGCGAHLQELRRTRSGALKVEDALPMAELLDLSLEQLTSRVIPIHRVRAEDIHA
jgi:tRNA pseudouridine55 synthase